MFVSLSIVSDISDYTEVLHHSKTIPKLQVINITFTTSFMRLLFTRVLLSLKAMIQFLFFVV